MLDFSKSSEPTFRSHPSMPPREREGSLRKASLWFFRLLGGGIMPALTRSPFDWVGLRVFEMRVFRGFVG